MYLTEYNSLIIEKFIGGQEIQVAVINGKAIGINCFGESAPGGKLLEYFEQRIDLLIIKF